jgi:LL-diaminopimelate aminotransferase
MQRNFGVDLDPAKEVNHCIGSKTALAMLPACFINPGDITLMTVPGYPVAGTHTRYYGGSVYRLPLTQRTVSCRTWTPSRRTLLGAPSCWC